ncbi:MAG: universal stress protein [Vicinamibacterales bacterium]
MTGPIVCGVDFSEDSRRALRWADLMSRRLAQPLVVVHAVEELLASAARMHYGADAIEATLLPELKQFVSQTIGDPPHARIQFGVGEAGEILRGTALSANAAMIVLGTQGLGQAGRLWFGSTTTRVLRESTVPVMAVPPRAAQSDTDPRIDEIIVGTDFGTDAREAIATAERLGKILGVAITALHAVPEVAAPDRWGHIAAKAVEEGLRDAQARVGSTVPADWSTEVRTGSPASVLVEAAAGRHALIVVGLSGSTSGHRPGTTAYRVLSDADAPVLAVPGR